MQCVILAGGLATRMRPLTEKIPKSLLPVGDRTFLDYQLDYFWAQGITDLVFCVGYKGEMIRDHLHEMAKSHPFHSIQFVDEGSELKGTGGALRLAFDQGVLKKRFFVIYGDSFLPIDFQEVWRTAEMSGAQALMTVMENGDRWDASNVCYSDGSVSLYDKKIHPKPFEMKYIDYGLSVLTRNVIQEYIPPAVKYDLADVLRMLSLQGNLAGFLTKQRFYEVGSFQGLEEFTQYVKKTANTVQRSP